MSIPMAAMTVTQLLAAHGEARSIADRATARTAYDDYADELVNWLVERQPTLVSDAHWQAIDAHERSLGEPHGRPRRKLASVADLLRIAHT